MAEEVQQRFKRLYQCVRLAASFGWRAYYFTRRHLFCAASYCKIDCSTSLLDHGNL